MLHTKTCPTNKSEELEIEMLQRTLTRRASVGTGKLGGKLKDMFTSLWHKPETRDERVKEYVPEVLEESLVEQRAVLTEASRRDVIVERGAKVLKELENKAPTPAIAGHLSLILESYGGRNVISQRALSYLLYPGSNAGNANEHPHELISSFHENFKLLIQEIEVNGCSIQGPTKEAVVNDEKEQQADQIASDSDASGGAVDSTQDPNKVVMQPASEVEPLDVTLFVKVAAGMALANVQCTDFGSAVKCCDLALAHAKESARLGGLEGMKAGELIRLKKFDEAIEAAQKSIEASNNVQGYLHGATALSKLRRDGEAVKLLEKAKECFPQNGEVLRLLATAKKDYKPALTATSAAPTEQLAA